MTSFVELKFNIRFQDAAAALVMKVLLSTKQNQVDAVVKVLDSDQVKKEYVLSQMFLLKDSSEFQCKPWSLKLCLEASWNGPCLFKQLRLSFKVFIYFFAERLVDEIHLSWVRIAVRRFFGTTPFLAREGLRDRRGRLHCSGHDRSEKSLNLIMTKLPF